MYAGGLILWPAVYQTLLEVAQALQYLHNLCIIHCDLKVCGRVCVRDCSRVRLCLRVYVRVCV